jgi:hypothetical protein
MGLKEQAGEKNLADREEGGAGEDDHSSLNTS